MADNLVSQPPLTTPIVDPNGMPSKAWAIWFRDLYRRTSYKGGNAIDDNAGLIDGTIETLEDAITQIIVNALGIANNSDAIDQNAIDISDNSDSIATNSENIGFLEYRSFGTDRPEPYDESAGYLSGDYVVYPDDDPQNYFIAKYDIAAPSGVFDPLLWSEESLKGQRAESIDSFVLAGYGAIGLDTATPLSDISVGSWIDAPMDVTLISPSRYITTDLATNSILFERVGIWSCSIKVSLQFDEVNSGRALYLRFYNIDTATAVSTQFVEGVGRNVGVGGFSFTVPLDISETQTGDRWILQVSGDSSFTSVESIGSVWYVTHSSEAKFI